MSSSGSSAGLKWLSVCPALLTSLSSRASSLIGASCAACSLLLLLFLLLLLRGWWCWWDDDDDEDSINELDLMRSMMVCWSLAVTRHKTATDSNNKTKHINTIGANSSLSSSCVLEEEDEEEEDLADDDMTDEGTEHHSCCQSQLNAQWLASADWWPLFKPPLLSFSLVFPLLLYC